MIYVFGPRSGSVLTAVSQQLIDRIIEQDQEVLLGDRVGADALVAAYLAGRPSPPKVHLYHAPRGPYHSHIRPEWVRISRPDPLKADHAILVMAGRPTLPAALRLHLDSLIAARVPVTITP